MFKKLFLAIIIAGVLPLSLFAQYSIKGHIVDADSRKSLPSAHIRLDGNFKTAVSDLEGNFLMKNIKKGTYTLKVSYLGYQTYKKQIVLNKDIHLNIKMKVKAIMEDEVIITATRANDRSGTTYKNVSKAELKKADLGKDLPYILNLTPSVVSSSDAGAGVGYTSIRIRGTDISRINVTMNGIPINDPESQGVWWVNMPDLTSSLNSVQIQRGVGTSSNGAAAFGASINMMSAVSAPKPFAEVNTAYGSFNTQRFRMAASTGLVNGKWSFDTRLSKIYTDGYVDRAFADLKSFYASAAHYGKNSILRINVFSGKERTYQAWNGVPKDSLNTNRTYNTYTYKNQTDNYQQDHYQLLYSKRINAFWNFNGALHYTKGRGYYESKKDNRKLSKYGLPNYIIGNDTIRRTDLVQQKWLDNDFYGFTFSFNYDNKKNIRMSIGGAANQYSGDHFGKIIWAQYALMGNDYEWYRNNGLKNTYNMYAKLAYQLNDKWGAYGDLQYRRVDYWMKGLHDDFKNLDGDYHYNFVNPKLGLNYKINTMHHLSFSAAIGQKEPSRNDFRDSYAGRVPKSEMLIDYELGYALNMQYVSFRANAYYMDYKDQLVMTGKVNDVGAPIMTNVAKSYRAGLEFAAGAKITKKLSWNANISLSRNKILSFTEYVDNWDTWSQDSIYLGTTTIAFSPDIVAANQIDYKPIKGMELMLNTKYVGKQYIDNTSNNYNSLPAYTTTDLILGYTFTPKWIKSIAVNFSINNIFNAKYASNAWVYSYNYGGKREVMDGYFPQAGINFMLGLDMKF